MHGVAHGVPQAAAPFPGHAFRHADGGDAPRLRHHDARGFATTAVVQEELRQLGGFASERWLEGFRMDAYLLSVFGNRLNRCGETIGHHRKTIGKP